MSSTETRKHIRYNKENYSVNGWELLAEQIIVRVTIEYRRALRKRKYMPNNSNAKSVIKSCERFFRSDWYKTLTTVPGEWLIEALKKEIRNERQPLYGVGSKEWLEKHKDGLMNYEY